MSLQVKVCQFTQQSGTGGQTVTVTGLDFTPVGALIFGNTQITNSGNFNLRRGFDDGTHRRAIAYNGGDFLGSYDNPEVAGSDSYSFLTTRNVAFNEINALGYIASFSSTGFVVQWDQNSNNWSAGAVWFVVLFGGVSVEVGSIVPPSTAGNQTTTFGLSDAFALWSFYVPYGTGTHSEPGCGGMGGGMAVACDTAQGATANATDAVSNPSVTRSYQATASAFVSSTTSAVTNTGTITAWHPSSIDVTWSANQTGVYYAYLVLGGAAAANLFTITQPTSLGVQRVTYTVANPVLLTVQSANHATSASLTTDNLFTFGAATPDLYQPCVWTGDTNGKAPPAWAVYWNATNQVFLTRAPTAEAMSTATSFGAVTDLSQGSLGIDWTTVDSTAREWIAVILGADDAGGVCGGSAPIVTTTYATRRLRRFSLPFDTNKQVKINRLEVLPQPGVGLSAGQGSDPVVMVRFSKDGGATWGNEIPLTIGKIGEYAHRAYMNRGPYGRNLVCEITDSDPVFSVLLDCFIDWEVGTS